MAAPDQPTTMEIKVITLAAQGKSREEIGRELFISPWTVRHYLDSLRNRLGTGGKPLTNVTHCLAVCIVQGHLQIDPINNCITAAELELDRVAA
jgi:DNA-binding NarL/FixJ family response regulator